MGSRFNPPPNWPLQEGFSPPPGWRPEPTWGEPPFGWQLWVEDAGERQRSATSARWAVAVSLVLGAAGLAIGMQPVSLLSGTGVLYVGAALAGGALVLAMAMRLKPWTQVVTAIAAFAVVANIVYVTHQLDVKRQQINDEISNITGASDGNAVNPIPVAAAPTPVDYDAKYPPARDVALPPCQIDPTTRWPTCLVAVRNRTPKRADYLITLEIASADKSVKYGEMTAYITGIAPNQYASQVTQGFTAMPPSAKITVERVQRVLS